MVACEFSGIVREAFAAKGHDAWSCDLLPTETGNKHLGNRHIQDDVRRYLDAGWDLMVAHPPCTYLTVSGNKWFKNQPLRSSGALVGAARRQARTEAIEFVKQLMDADIPKIALENPIGVLSSVYRKPDQVIQPWMFGHTETKATCLWLKNLPLLVETNNVKEATMRLTEAERMRLHYLPKTAERAHLRSITFQGVADAMAEQWG